VKRLLVLLCLVFSLPAAQAEDLARYIDPFIGTGGHGHTYPGATLPFGMVQLSPDTRLTGWDGCSIYHDSDRAVYGFSHTHLSGTGVGDYGDVLLMPVTGRPHLFSGYPDQVESGYGSRFAKEKEQAQAGYYRTFLEDYGIEVELTATARTGLHRYVFPSGQEAHVIIDLEHRDKLLDVGCTVVDNRTIEGFRRSEGWARDQLVHFQAVFSRPFSVARLVPSSGELSDRDSKAVLSFGNEGGELLVQVALSAVDAQGAQGNLKTEWADFDFAAVRQAAGQAWSDILAPFAVEGADESQLTVLATALYHSYLAPNLFSDADGRFRGMDLKTHHARGRDQYTVFSLWDTYRATHPLFTLMQRRRTVDFVHTALSHFQLGGRLPVWELAANETDCMIGYHSVSFIADAWLKGIRGYDPELAFEGMLDSAYRDHFGLEAYRRQGFIAIEDEPESVSKTLEYAYDDVCISRMAWALGYQELGEQFAQRAQGWRHLYDPASRCFRPRRNGQWLKPYDPRQVDFHHTEANGWQYRFAAPHHMPQHIDLLGSDAACSAVLDSLFTLTSETTGRHQPDITGRMGQYAHGNEPSHHMAWLYHFTGEPEKSRARVTRILEEFYTDQPDGLIGNEDCGQMSSWYVLAAYGLYDVAPTSRQWLIIPPLHEHMSLTFEDGAVFTTRREGSGPVARVLWNGKPLDRSWLAHSEVIGGGELVFELGEASGWGVAPANRPGLPLESAVVLAAPWAEASSDRFRGRQQVALRAQGPEAQIYWTLDPEGDPLTGTLYTEPLTLERTCDLRFVAVSGPRTSPVVTARFNAIPHDWQLSITSTANPQYTAGGPDALIDGRRGTDNWRTGGWHGYEGQDFSCVLDLGEMRAVRKVGASFLQDMRSWIMMPRELVVEVSADGIGWQEVGRVGHQVPEREEGVFRRDFTVSLDGLEIRAVRLYAEGYGPLPEWHLGAGGPSFIFVDELIVE
jgi:predicted alpha-1,2-mannosidase